MCEQLITHVTHKLLAIIVTAVLLAGGAYILNFVCASIQKLLLVQIYSSRDIM